MTSSLKMIKIELILHQRPGLADEAAAQPSAVRSHCLRHAEDQVGH